MLPYDRSLARCDLATIHFHINTPTRLSITGDLGIDASLGKTYQIMPQMQLAHVEQLVEPNENESTLAHRTVYLPRKIYLLQLGRRNLLLFRLSYQGDDSLGFDSDKGLPEKAAARAPKSPCTSNNILRALRALICDMSSGRDVVRAV